MFCHSAHSTNEGVWGSLNRPILWEASLVLDTPQVFKVPGLRYKEVFDRLGTPEKTTEISFSTEKM